MDRGITHNRISLSDKAAVEIIAAVREAATAAGVPVAVAVLDEAATLFAFQRMDGVTRMPIAVSQDKARTAALTGFDSADVARTSASDPDLRALLQSQPGIALFAGGVVLRVGDDIVGAIGVSGGSAAQDAEIAEAGRSRFAELLETGIED